MFGMKYEHFDIKREAKGLNGKQWARRAAFILAICATAALALAFPALRRYATEERRDLPRELQGNYIDARTHRGAL